MTTIPTRQPPISIPTRFRRPGAKTPISNAPPSAAGPPSYSAATHRAPMPRSRIIILIVMLILVQHLSPLPFIFGPPHQAIPLSGIITNQNHTNTIVTITPASQTISHATSLRPSPLAAALLIQPRTRYPARHLLARPIAQQTVTATAQIKPMLLKRR